MFVFPQKTEIWNKIFSFQNSLDYGTLNPNKRTINISCGHQIVVMSTKKAVTLILRFFIHYKLISYQNIHFFWSGSSKKAIFLKFDHFSHSMWSSHSGHEHKKDGHMNPRVLYCTIDLWHIYDMPFDNVYYGIMSFFSSKFRSGNRWCSKLWMDFCFKPHQNPL